MAPCFKGPWDVFYELTTAFDELQNRILKESQKAQQDLAEILGRMQGQISLYLDNNTGTMIQVFKTYATPAQRLMLLRQLTGKTRAAVAACSSISESA